MNTLPRGFIPVMLTPFNDDLSVDYATLRKLCDYYIDNGAVGLFANCLSSEMYELTADFSRITGGDG
jgi:4-hydroxy-tetrahydrodipicolinate synthase